MCNYKTSQKLGGKRYSEPNIREGILITATKNTVKLNTQMKTAVQERPDQSSQSTGSFSRKSEFLNNPLKANTNITNKLPKLTAILEEVRLRTM